MWLSFFLICGIAGFVFFFCGGWEYFYSLHPWVRCIQLSPVACQPCNAFCIVTVALGRSAGFAARLDVVSTLQAPTPALFPWLYLFGSRNPAAWEESAFVRMSGVPWFRSYCHLLGGGREVSWKCFSHLFSSAFYLGCVLCKLWILSERCSDFTANSTSLPAVSATSFSTEGKFISSPELDFCNLWLHLWAYRLICASWIFLYLLNCLTWMLFCYVHKRIETRHLHLSSLRRSQSYLITKRYCISVSSKGVAGRKIDFPTQLYLEGRSPTWL